MTYVQTQSAIPDTAPGHTDLLDVGEARTVDIGQALPPVDNAVNLMHDIAVPRQLLTGVAELQPGCRRCRTYGNNRCPRLLLYKGQDCSPESSEDQQELNVSAHPVVEWQALLVEV